MKKKENEVGCLLDVGCGIGIFLEIIANNKKSWHLYGIEPSKYAFKIAHNKFGDNIYNCTLEEAQFKDNSFDVITLWNVLEHVPDPFALLKEAKRTLRDDGFVIVSVPNVSFYLIKYLPTKIFFQKPLTWYPAEHLYHFSVESLKKLINKAGFVVCKQVVSTPFLLGGSLENLMKRFGFVALKILFRCTGINLGGIEFYLKKAPKYY